MPESDDIVEETESAEEVQEINPGDYVIDRAGVGKVIGQASNGNWVVEWPDGPGHSMYEEHKAEQIVVIDL